jgi:hypothetical protein
MLKMQQRKQSLKLQKQSNNELYQTNVYFENGVSIRKI